MRGWSRLFASFLMLLAVGSMAVPSAAAPQFTATLVATPASYFGKCPALIKLHGVIVNNPPYVATVQYSLLNSDGIDSFKMTATFNAAHTFAVSDARTPSIPGGYWVQLRVWKGAEIVAVSDKATFTVECQGPKGTPNPNATPTPCPPTAAGVPCNPKPTATPCVSTVAPCGPVHTPNPNATPCRPIPGEINCRPTPRPCHDVTGRPIPCKLPDLTPGNPVVVGGHSTNWGGGVTLTDKDAFLNSNGHCAFNIAYIQRNIGLADALPPFKNVLRADAATVSIQSAMTQPAGTQQTVHTQAYLPGGVHTLSLKLDDGNVVVESNEANNVGAIKYQLTGNCASTAPTDRLPTR
jgi:hypothetical protein